MNADINAVNVTVNVGIGTDCYFRVSFFFTNYKCVYPFLVSPGNLCCGVYTHD